ncbi:M48 family metalloprotease [Ferrovum myxofaciens]|jgi:predicted Zn-dependent protease|uniref:M48 family metallopeptidase n=3 Tax=root TaxID=1 RepID=A0A9E6SYE3_9PROT|nr:M48 family metalloprotease [Ferrovum myxofaciens]NDU90786.1 M48 family metallopeptidase [Ferrovum sp.]QKE38033.2 MAG: M48 family metallopeptidase [Ferrovum myxofaciens]QKE40606.1 MAG: M48 family metallopeptidase [Ferrovum myxofaciens]QWY78472.1 MAG: M48 family metallopeptidase [Ferrovum myxofaciens]
MSTMKRWLLFLYVSMLSVHLTAYELPDLGDSSSMTLSSKDEMALGRQVMQEIRADPAYFNDPESVDFVSSVGHRLLAVSDDLGDQHHFEFFILEDPTLNAFALPGGFIGVHTALIEAADNESELASVLAHEISHVTQHHIARAMEDQNKNLPLSLAAMAAAILAARSSPDGAMGGVVGAQAGMVQAQLNFSRGNEREADRLGIRRLLKTDYDPRAMATFFTKLGRYGRFYEGAPAFLQTHPLTTERLAEIQDRLQNVPYRQVQDGPDFALIKARIQALVGTPHEALESFQNHDYDIHRSEDVPLLYGKAVALWRSRAYGEAQSLLEQVRAVSPPNALFDSLRAQITLDSGHVHQAILQFQHGLQRFPDERALNYGYITALLTAGLPEQALKIINERISLTSSDEQLYEFQSQAYSALNQQMMSHEALAHAYLLLDNPSAAMDQLQIALGAGDGNFYQKSQVEATMREIKAELAARKGNKK